MKAILKIFLSNVRCQYLLLASASLLLAFSGYSQDVPDSLILYDSDYKFTEGIFLDYASVKKNSPIPKSRILSEYSYNEKDFFDKVLSSSKFFYYDNLGNKLEAKSSRVWGYSRNGFLYIRIDQGYYRITLVGSICHFIGYRSYETYDRTYSNYYYNRYPYSSRTPTTTTTEMQQYLFDFNTGNVVEYNVQGLTVLLMSDPELHDEYVKLSKKKKKQLKFMYIRKYNERNPLYLIKK